MKKFKQSVSMKCSKNQYEKDLKEGMEKLGYKLLFGNAWGKCQYFMTSTCEGNEVYPNQEVSRKSYYIPEYNPALFLAIAGMLKGDKICAGEWVKWSGNTPCLGEVIGWRESSYGTNYQLNVNGNKSSHDSCNCRHIRKATLEELIQHFSTTKTNTMPPQTRIMTATQAQRIINIACATWKPKLAQKWAEKIVLGKTISVPEAEYKTMREACTADQHKLFDEIFGKEESPFKDGQLVIVRDCSIDKWQIRYSSGKLSLGGNYLAYNEQRKSGDVTPWKEMYALPTDFILPS